MRNLRGQFIKGHSEGLGRHWKVKDTSKNRLAQLGKKLSEDHKKKCSEALLGEKSYLYKDGRCKDKKMYNKERSKSIRLATLAALGGKCVRCGFDDYRALQIDHINGEGNKERKQSSAYTGYQRKVLESFLRGENKYQLLCSNCNWIKRSENNEVRKVAST